MVWQVTVCKGVLYELFWLPCRWLVNELDGHAVDGRYILLPHGAARSRSADHADHSVLCASHPYPCPQPYHVFLSLPLCLVLSTSKVSFLKNVHTIAVCFFGPPSLCLLFVTADLIQCKIVYPLISHHTST